MASRYVELTKKNPRPTKGPQVESTMCYLRGVIMLRMGRAKDAQESLMEALAIDYKNFDAFETLIGGDMMTIDEGDTNVL